MKPREIPLLDDENDIYFLITALPKAVREDKPKRIRLVFGDPPDKTEKSK